MKIFLIAFILTFSLILCSCADNHWIKHPGYGTIDTEASDVGNSVKTIGYPFRQGFTYHEWEGQEVEIKWIPLNTYRMGRDWRLRAAFWQKYNFDGKFQPIKKLVTSKYFDIWVDITEGERTFYNATNMRDVAYDKLIGQLEEHYDKIKRVYGEPSNIDGNNKIEVVFHQQGDFSPKKDPKESVILGLFNEYNIHKEIWYTAEMDVLYINSDYFMNKNIEKERDYNVFTDKCFETIFHELQHDIFANRNFNTTGFRVKDYPDMKWINEALSESTYFVIYRDKKPPWRSSDFTKNNIRNGQYFFSWSRTNAPTENYNTASHFMYWLYLHGGGDQIISDIYKLSPNKIIDMESIVAAARKNIPELKDNNAPTIVYKWYMANLLNYTDSIYGYKGKTTIKVDYANDSYGKIFLKCYCAVYTTLDMYSNNSSQRGLFVGNINANNILIFNQTYSTFVFPSILVNSITSKIPTVNIYLDKYQLNIDYYDDNVERTQHLGILVNVNPNPLNMMYSRSSMYVTKSDLEEKLKYIVIMYGE